MRGNLAINPISSGLKKMALNSGNYGKEGRGFFENIGSALFSPVELGYRTLSSGDVTRSLTKTYGKDKEFMLGKAVGGVVGGMFGMRAGMGALRGGFTDGQGNFDAPGIPLI